MTSPIRASAMLCTAEKLAGINSGRGRPALCDLRRATSTAYYALFHQIIRHAVLAATPDATEDELARYARWMTHAGIRKAADQVVWISVNPLTNVPNKEAREGVAFLRGETPALPPPGLLIVADAFTQLQEARHAADYSNAYDPVKYTTLTHVATARDGVEATWALWKAQESRIVARQAAHRAYRRFLHLATLYSGGPRSR